MKPKKSKKHAPATEPSNTETAVQLNPIPLPADIVKGELAAGKSVALVAHAEGLNILEGANGITTLPALARFPLGYRPVRKDGVAIPGRVTLTGKLMNIAEFCRMKTGRAWNEKHAERVLKDEGTKLTILKDAATKKALSEELDAMRRPYHDALKGEVTKFHARRDVEIQGAQLKQTATGLRLTSIALLPTKSAEDLLRAQLAKAQAQVKALTGKLPAKIVKQALGEDAPIDVPSSTETQPEPAVTEPARGEPVPA